MRYGLITVAYRERRFIGKFLEHVPYWVSKKVALLSEKPWFGEPMPDDGTLGAVSRAGGVPIRSVWATEQDQRNSGVSLLEDCDWIIVLDPDEFLSNSDWNDLRTFLEDTDADAVVCEGQKTYWKKGWVADPPRDYQMLIAIRPGVQFVDKRVVNTGYAVAPVWVHHFSWARTNTEVWNKISHYAHAEDFDIKDWYDNVWKRWKPGMTDVHPTTPDTLHKLVPAQLPPELERLKLWPR
jgi:hypothetical protein